MYQDVHYVIKNQMSLMDQPENTMLYYSKHEKKRINNQVFKEVPSFSAHSSAKFIGKSVQS